MKSLAESIEEIMADAHTEHCGGAYEMAGAYQSDLDEAHRSTHCDTADKLRTIRESYLIEKWF